MLGHTTIRFYGDLAEVAWDADRDGLARVPVDRPRSVKDAIESCGVPHTEVDLVLVNGTSVDFGHAVTAGDRVAVYPLFVNLDVPSMVRPDPLDEERFVLDVHLGRLAGRLRLLGFDASYRNDADDADLAAESVHDRRWLLTRDRGLLMRASVVHGYLIRSDDPPLQVAEVMRRFELYGKVEPLTRCANCNGLLAPVPKARIDHLLQPGTRRDHDVFVQCGSCGQLYWEGSHSGELQAFVRHVRSGRD
ncbi:MAG: twitching motility protein PilT [Nitriliruptorales bacterium]|nr:twitching motility protein PilT [Nitriliruptorales bacterium]